MGGATPNVVGSFRQRGCVTNRCQITAAKSFGVRRDVIREQRWHDGRSRRRPRAVKPPVTTDNPVDRAHHVRTQAGAPSRCLAKHLRRSSPPPTEKTNRASSAPRTGANNQFEKVVSQPSSLVRAVSSADVVGGCIGLKPTDLAKSLTA